MSVSNKEEKALLELTQYFSETWSAIDVGSNKGYWSDILINYRDGSTQAGKYSIYMLEPNELLLNYTRVKYDQNDNIFFDNRAVSKENGISDFYFFTNKNNGLSSLLNNPKWDYLPKQHTKVSIISLDYLINDDEDIDIIKIDIEGNEYNAILGLEKTLKEKKVKFIQIEYSEHYKLLGKGFKDIIEFVNQFGYKAWSYDGEYFKEEEAEYFNEDYRLDNLYITYKEIGRYHYTQDWNSEFIKNTEFLKGKVNLALELGAYEGKTSNYICDHLLTKEIKVWDEEYKEKGLASPGRLICVDPLTDEYIPGHKDNEMFVGQYERFIKNTKGQPIELVRKRSEDAWEYLSQYLFDFIYIDGDHSLEAVFKDGCEAFKVLRIGGIILFDDYDGWEEQTTLGINKFLELHKNKVKVLIKNYQLLVEKIAEW